MVSLRLCKIVIGVADIQPEQNIGGRINDFVIRQVEFYVKRSRCGITVIGQSEAHSRRTIGGCKIGMIKIETRSGQIGPRHRTQPGVGVDTVAVDRKHGRLDTGICVMKNTANVI